MKRLGVSWVDCAVVSGLPVLGKLGMAVALAVAIAGCATAPPGSDGVTGQASLEAKRAMVKARVEARWDALIKSDLDAAYAFLSPASRAITSLEDFKTRARAGGFRAIEIQSIDCEAESCQVRMWLTYDHRLMKGIKTPIEESWVLEQGQAWYVWRM